MNTPTTTTINECKTVYDCNHDSASQFVINDHPSCCDCDEEQCQSSETTTAATVSTGNDEDEEEVTNEYVLVRVLKGFVRFKMTDC